MLRRLELGFLSGAVGGCQGGDCAYQTKPSIVCLVKHNTTLIFTGKQGTPWWENNYYFQKYATNKERFLQYAHYFSIPAQGVQAVKEEEHCQHDIGL